MSNVNANRIYVLLIGALFLILSSFVFAQDVVDERRNFDNQLSIISSIEHDIINKKNDYSILKRFQQQLKNLNQQAIACINEEQKKNKKVDTILQYLSGGLDTSVDNYTQLLTQEKKLIKQTLAECSFISYRCEEVVHLIQSKIALQDDSTAWKRSPSILELINNTSNYGVNNQFSLKQNSQLIKIIGISMMLLLFFALSWFLLFVKYLKKNTNPFRKKAMKFMLLSVYFIVFGLFLAGYHYYALMIIPKMVVSALIILILYQLIRMISKLQHLFDLNESTISKKIHTYFGLSHNKTMPELIVLRALLYTSLISWSVILLLYIWGLPQIYLDQIFDTAFNGVTLFNITVFPVRTLRAIFIFFILMLLGRYFSTSIMRSQAFSKEYHLQVTISTLIRYATFIIAAVLSLYIAGINFAGIAIAFGALLVGVGFGLQQIVNDFISGLILLSNNLVRPADFVSIDNIEGTIKKIRLLSTEIQSDDSVVLIPNSFLISRSINNYSNEEQIYYADTQIVIEQLSDLKKAEKIMLDVAVKNKNVIKNDVHKPYTEIELFNNRGAMGVYITLYFPIVSASQRDEIRTQLNRSILVDIEKADINVHIMRGS